MDRFCTVIIAFLASMPGQVNEFPDPARPLTAPAAEGEIQRLIQDLGDPSYERRTLATRRLLAIGMPAHSALRQAASSGDLESALRANRMVGILESLLFAGCEMHIQFTKQKIRWDEPVDLIVSIHNKATFPAQVPFEPPAKGAEPHADEARQVANMLDVAEWLHVFGPEGRELSLKVDEISADPRVVDVVQARLNSGPTTGIPPGQTLQIKAMLFNRGWARYPLLDAGEYTAVFDYAPQWSDEALAEAKIGRIRSNMANLEVVQPAPQAVSRGGVEAEVYIERVDDDMFATLVNRCDTPIVLNCNFGAAPPFAQASWLHDSGDRIVEVPLQPSAALHWADFQEARLVEVAPGASHQLGRIAVRDLRQALVEGGVDLSAGSPGIRFRYTNLCDRGWQNREQASLRNDATVPEVLRRPLPRRLLNLHQTSPTMSFDQLK